jgi:hypothetical protein
LFPLQVAFRQLVAEPTNPSQLVGVIPSQSAAVQGSDALPAGHAGRVPWGAPTMGVQVPSVPVASQAAH